MVEWFPIEPDNGFGDRLVCGGWGDQITSFGHDVARPKYLNIVGVTGIPS